MSSEIVPDNNLPPPLPVFSPQPWGFWATTGWTLLIVLGVVLAQFLVGFIMVFANKDIASLDPEELGTNGVVVAMITCFYAPVAVGLCVLFAFLRKQFPLKDYLGMKWIESRKIPRWCIGLLFLVLVSDGLTSLTNRPVIPDFMLQVYDTAGNAMPFLWLALIVAAPFSEEFVFRGFLFTGLKHSRLGGLGAVIITSLLWAAIHLQYDLYGIATIFVGGIFLGWVRLKTDSIWLCIILHGMMNLIATLEVAAYRAFISP
jgi:uncharacterized protein